MNIEIFNYELESFSCYDKIVHILLSETDRLDIFPDNCRKRITNFHGTAVAIRINTEKIQNYQEVIDAARKRGEETAKTIKNAFKQASIPSKGLLSE